MIFTGSASYKTSVLILKPKVPNSLDKFPATSTPAIWTSSHVWGDKLLLTQEIRAFTSPFPTKIFENPFSLAFYAVASPTAKIGIEKAECSLGNLKDKALTPLELVKRIPPTPTKFGALPSK